MCIIIPVAHSTLLSLVRADMESFSPLQPLDVNIILFSRIPEYLVRSQWCKESQACFPWHRSCEELVRLALSGLWHVPKVFQSCREGNS